MHFSSGFCFYGVHLESPPPVLFWPLCCIENGFWGSTVKTLMNVLHFIAHNFLSYFCKSTNILLTRSHFTSEMATAFRRQKTFVERKKDRNRTLCSSSTPEDSWEDPFVAFCVTFQELLGGGRFAFLTFISRKKTCINRILYSVCPYVGQYYAGLPKMYISNLHLIFYGW